MIQIIDMNLRYVPDFTRVYSADRTLYMPL